MKLKTCIYLGINRVTYKHIFFSGENESFDAKDSGIKITTKDISSNTSTEKADKKGFSRRTFLKASAAGGGIAAAALLGDDFIEYSKQQNERLDATRTAIASLPTQTPEPTATLTPLEQAKMEMRETVDVSWDMFKQLREPYAIGMDEAILLLPTALAKGETKSVIEMFISINDDKHIEELPSAMITPMVISTGIPIDEAVDIFHDATKETSNGIASYPVTGALLASVAIENAVTPEDVYATYDKLSDTFSRDAAKVFLPLVYSQFDIPQIENAWDEIRRYTKKEYLDNGVDEILATGMLVSGEPAETVFSTFKEMKNQIDERYDTECAQLAISAIANGHNIDQVVAMHQLFKDKLKQDGNEHKGTFAASLTLSTILHDKTLNILQTMPNMNGMMPYAYWYYFLNPMSPLSPFGWGK